MYNVVKFLALVLRLFLFGLLQAEGWVVTVAPVGLLSGVKGFRGFLMLSGEESNRILTHIYD